MIYTFSRLFFIILTITSLQSCAQDKISPLTMPTGKDIQKLPYILYKEPILKELFEIKGNVRSVKSTVTEFQTPNAVIAKDGKEVYTITLNVDPTERTITEISTKEKNSGYMIKNVYAYDQKYKPKTMKYYEDEMKGKGWEFKDEKIYTYARNQKNEYINRQTDYTEPRPGVDQQIKVPELAAYYDQNGNLVAEDNNTGKTLYSYNKQQDLIEMKVDFGKDARGIFVYKYQYDSKGNWIKKEEYDSNDVKNNVLMSITSRTIVY
jgi:YD repeat-containing protein